ncbi:MAG: alpha/beta fold hydrolase [Flavobacteriaceae bacterium]
MPFIENTSFKPHLLLRNKHVNTLYRYFLSKVKIDFIRQRMSTKDHDFIDLDVSSVNSKKVVIAIHGLEGSSDSNYIHSITEVLNTNNYDVIAYNMRGCSGEANKLLSSYHSGKISDLIEVIDFIKANYKYQQIHIIGYSLSGNMTLKYMGEYADTIPNIVKSAIAISAPCDLKGSSNAISARENKIYMNGFLKTLKVKALEKIERFPDAGLDKQKIIFATNFSEFDSAFTAPTHGFIDADDYWKQSSANQFLKFITKPTLLISSKDDPFLSNTCLPINQSKNHPFFTFLQTNYGGHIGFTRGFFLKKERWLEYKILDFIKKNS